MVSFTQSSLARRALAGIVAVTVTATATVALTGSASSAEDPDPTPAPAVTATLAASSVEVGEKIEVTATLASGKSGQAMLLQRKTKKGWTKVVKGKSVDGVAEFAVTATKAGKARYRVLVPATKKTGKAVSDRLLVEIYRWRYLADMEWQEEGDWKTGVVTLAGKRYPESVFATNDFWGDMEVNLAGKCTTLRGTAGLSDASKTGSVGGLTVYRDGAEAYYSEVTLAEAKDVSLPIDGTLRIGLRATKVDGPSGFPNVALGNAAVYCRS